MLIDKLHEDLKDSQLDKNEIKVATLRLLLSEINYARIAKNEDLNDQEIISVIQKEVKKRREAAEGFRKGSREDAAVKEENEAKILEEYLPTQLSNEELTKLIEEAITNTGANSVSDMGKVIGMVMGKVAGQADGGRVSGIVKEQLSSRT